MTADEPSPPPVLGPFQYFWDVWEYADEAVKGKDFAHFPGVTAVQFVELAEHLADGNRLAAAREATDVISIALNALRWLGLRPADVAQLVDERARELAQPGQVHALLERYDRSTDGN